MIQEKERVNYVFLCTVVVYLTASLIISTFGNVPFAPMILISQLSLVLAPGILLIRRRDFRRSIPHAKLSFGTVVLVVILTLCIEPVLSFVNALSQCFVEAPVTETIMDASADYSFPVMFLLVALVPAILEEMVYRGVFFQAYCEEGVFSGAILSGLLFGLMHGNLNQFLYAFLMGMVFALTVYATGSIFGSMIMHLTVNGLSTIILYVYPFLQNELEKTAEETGTDVSQLLDVASREVDPWLTVKSLVVPAIVGLVLAVFVFLTIADRCGTREKLKEALHNKDGFQRFRHMITVPLAVGGFLMALLVVAAEFL